MYVKDHYCKCLSDQAACGRVHRPTFLSFTAYFFPYSSQNHLKHVAGLHKINEKVPPHAISPCNIMHPYKDIMTGFRPRL